MKNFKLSEANGNNYFLARATPAGQPPDPDAPARIRYMGLGLLFKSGLVKEGSGRVFYCPSSQDRWHMYDMPNNPWPPSSNTTRCGYSVRSAINSDPTVDSHVPELEVAWGTGGIFDAFNPTWPAHQVPSPVVPGQMFKLAQMKNRAIISDICSIDANASIATAAPDRVANVHQKGLNVLYANGAGKWVPRSTIEAQIQMSLGPTNRHSFASSASAARLHHQIWNNFDAETQLYPTAP